LTVGWHKTNVPVRRSFESAEQFSDEIIADLLEDDPATASFDRKKWSNPHHKGDHAAGHFIKWHTIKNRNQASRRMCGVSATIACTRQRTIYGSVYDEDRSLNEVKEATEAGKAAA
jgi:carbonic anhydrase